MENSKIINRRDSYIPELHVIRLEGNHIHNLKVLKDGGEFLIARRNDKEFDHKNCGVCTNCKEWLLRSSLPKHQRTCPKLVEFKMTKGQLITESDVITGKYPFKVSERMRKEVLPSMTGDELTEIATSDEAIMNLGEKVLMKNEENELK